MPSSNPPEDQTCSFTSEPTDMLQVIAVGLASLLLFDLIDSNPTSQLPHCSSELCRVASFVKLCLVLVVASIPTAMQALPSAFPSSPCQLAPTCRRVCTDAGSVHGQDVGGMSRAPRSSRVAPSDLGSRESRGAQHSGMRQERHADARPPHARPANFTRGRCE